MRPVLATGAGSSASTCSRGAPEVIGRFGRATTAGGAGAAGGAARGVAARGAAGACACATGAARRGAGAGVEDRRGGDCGNACSEEVPASREPTS
ncbi:MAG: hypothetical protein EOP82_30155 [Variovorax sp.]|nr:MAG: hypothetical protein EOP82_30155 [Variovorax sp.]